MTLNRPLPTISSGQHLPPTNATAAPTKCYQYKLHGGNFRSVALSAAQNLIFLLQTAKWKVEHSKKGKFTRTEQMPQASRVPDNEVQTVLTEVLSSTLSSHSDLLQQGVQTVTQLVAAHTINEIVRALDSLAAFHTAALAAIGGQAFSPLAPNVKKQEKKVVGIDIGKKKIERPNSYFSFSIEKYPETLVVSWPLIFGEDYVKAATTIAGTLRAEQRDPSFVDFIAFHIGYHLLHTGHQMNDEARGLGTVGFRKDTQTYLSLGDSGEGHVWGTTRKNRWMRGVVVHVENQERPHLTSDQIESYRPASIHDFARTRLHTGASAPNTYYIGRAMRDSRTGEFGHDFVKVVNTTSSAATAAFRLGAAECKVAMDGLTAGQIVAYMRGLVGHTLRSHKQYMSAAFNLSHPILDDLNPTANGEPRLISGKMDIAMRGIELAVLGGFDKITWDGESDSNSCNGIRQLGFRNALELVHRAHEVGLTTYMSAGFKVHNIKDAVLAGLDGVGIGAGLLKHMDRVTGMHGPYTEESIDRLTVARDDAANSVRGRGVHLLARLDQMYFEGSLTADEAAIREPLYEALYRKDEDTVQQIICENRAAWRVAAIQDDGERQWVGRARRLLRTDYPLLKSGILKVMDGEVLWDEFIRCLQALVDEEDDAGIYAYYDSESWRAFRKAYREVIGQTESCQGDSRITLKVAPYS